MAIQEMKLQEIDEVSGGRYNMRMLAEGGVLMLAGGLAVDTGGLSLIAVGSIALAMGGGWATLGICIP